MAINLTNADSYFTGHVDGGTWADYSDARRTAAIAQAKRELSSVLGSALSETATTDADAIRHDVAAYEYAFLLLLNSATAKAADNSGADVSFEKGQATRKPVAPLTPLVLRYLGVAARISRG